MLLTLYRMVLRLAAPGLRVMLARRVRRGKEWPARLGERWGVDATPRPEGRLIWVHAASVGEAVSVLPVLALLVSEARVLITTGTVSSAAMLAERLPALGLADRVLHRFVPLDVPVWTARFLDHWRPDAAGFVESEIWPNLLSACARRAIPTMLINARLSPGSFGAWRRAPHIARALFGRFAAVQAQSAEVDRRLQALGAPPALLVGNLKFSAVALPFDADELARLRTMLADRPVWLAASTHPGEDAALLAAHASLAAMHSGLVFILVPRHPERGSAIAAAASAFAVTRRGAREDPPEGGGVWVVDTLGELGLFYRLVGHAFVGRSLGEAKGGQNPLEPARLGCAVAVGPNVTNFREVVGVLSGAGALTRVEHPAALVRWVDEMIRDPARRAAMGAAGVVAATGFAELPGQVATTLLDLAKAR
jgi:3-deoxy-D-manno-octulosonic-acid transferase